MTATRRFVLVVCLLALGCQQPPSKIAIGPAPPPAGGPRAVGGLGAGGPKALGADPKVNPSGPVLGFLHGVSIRWDDLRPIMVELSGGEALAEYVVDVNLSRRLQQRGLRVDDQMVRAERAIFTASVSSDPNEAERLLQHVRVEQKLGEKRFERLLRRNAGLRLLVQDEVDVPPSIVQKAYDYEHGPRHEARLIVVEALNKAADVVRRARAGESFAELATLHSTDDSRAAGGQLDPIRTGDTTWPQAVRAAVSQLEPGQVSDPILLEGSFAVLKLQRRIEAHPVPFDQVEADLTRRARRGVERTHMQRLARQFLRDAQLILTDSALSKSWQRRKALMLGESRP